MLNVPAPAIVQNHATVGLGIRPTRHLEITVGYYRAFENSGTGPIYGPTGPIPGSSVTNTYVGGFVPVDVLLRVARTDLVGA